MRDPDLQKFVDAIAAAFAARTEPASPITTLSNTIFDALASDAGEPLPGADPELLPVCHHLAPALVAAATGTPATAAVANAFSTLTPRLQWRKRPRGDGDPDGFQDNHANTLLIGPGGLEERNDVRIGASLVAPQIVYPDHSHPPEEMYLALSPGEWRNDETEWHTPGIGGLIHNPPAIVHAMRAQTKPLFAIWCLWQS